MSRREIAALIVLAAAAFVLRILQIGEVSISHPEIYVPRIPLPEGLSVPAPHFGLPEAIGATVVWDTQPPGYYALMWFVTFAFGPGIWALRLPSAIAGAATTVALVGLGRSIGSRTAGWVAGVFLACNGYHILWSRTARGYALLALLGVIATWALHEMARQGKPRKALWLAYACSMLLALSINHLFWSVLAAHILWAALRASQDGFFSETLAVEICVALLGSPLLVVAAHQSGNTWAYLSTDTFSHLRSLLHFGFSLPLENTVDTFAPAGGGLDWALSSSSPLGWLLTAVGAVFAAAGIARAGRGSGAVPTASKWLWYCIACAAVATAVGAVLIAALLYAEVPRGIDTATIMVAAPVAILLAALAIRSNWRTIASLARKVPLTNGIALVTLTALVPLLLTGAFAALAQPILSSRGLLMLVPFLLLLLALGFRGLTARPAALALAGLTAACVLGAGAFYHWGRSNGLDYRAFADSFTPRLHNGDVVYLAKAWYATPMYYYLPEEGPLYTAGNVAEKVMQIPGSRLWTILFETDSEPEGLEKLKSSYRLAYSWERAGIRGSLYEPVCGTRGPSLRRCGSGISGSNSAHWASVKFRGWWRGTP